MLVALPSAIAFGVTIFGVIGPAQAATGALAGMIGTACL
jgi:SulP family sulfate permease